MRSFLHFPAPRRARRRLAPHLLVCLALVAAPSLLLAPLAFAGTTGSTNLLMPQGPGTETQDGDYFTADNVTTPCPGTCPLEALYRYYIEVPAGLGALRVQIFDADIGAGGANEQYAQRDRTRETFNTKVKYTLKNPAGTTVATQTCGATTTAFCVDDAWSTLYSVTTGTIPNGDWELDVDQTTDVPNGHVETGTTATNDINAMGIQADTGTQGSGTELPVYYLAQNQIGQNLTSATQTTPATKTYTFYPYITSGCSFAENDFDFDLNNGTAGQNVGSIDFTSRSGSFTKNLAATSLSQNNLWNTNTVSGYTSSSDSTDYGIWTMQASITNYENPAMNGNYANIYLGNYAATGASTTGPTNNNPTANTFRVYFSASTGGAPVKPYLTQQARYVYNGGSGGPNPPVVGSTTTIQVSISVVNPTAEAITFSATNLVKSNVPGAGATYGGSGTASVTQGTITAQPAGGGTGTISWNPGTLAAGTTALLTYIVDVKPTSAGQLIPVVGTVASGNGTTAVYVDETGNNTSTFGPICEVTATQGVVSPAEVADLHVSAAGGAGGAIVTWETASEIAAAGFDLYRLDPAGSTWQRVNRTFVPSLAGTPQGGIYRVLDAGAPSSGRVWYQVVETETGGGHRHYPFSVEVEPAAADMRPLTPGGYDRTAHRDTSWAARLAAARSAFPVAVGGERGEGASAVPGPSGAAQMLRIGVTQDGLYRITPAVLAQLVGAAAVSHGKTYPKLSLTNQGQPVAWMPDTDGSVLFYGQAIQSIYTTENVYWLRQGNGGIAMGSTALTGTPATGSPTATFSTTVNTREATFAATALPLDPESDYWFWSALTAGDPENGSASFTVAAPNATGGGSPALTAHLMGATAGANDVQISLNGTVLGNATWSGITPYDATFPALGALATGGNTVVATAILPPDTPSSIAYVQSFDVSYERTFAATGDALSFDGSGNALVTVTGFSGPGVRLFDLTNPRQPALVAGARVDALQGGAAQLTLQPASASTPYLAVGPQGALAPASVRVAPTSGLSVQAGGADYLVLTTSDLVPAATALAALRTAQGLRTAVVDVADVMTDFNYGISSPHALQTYLSYIQTAWRPVPRYVVLAGAGSFDYRNFLGFGGELVPPLMVGTDSGVFSSDNHLVDVNGDGIPDFAVGRLPVLSNAELQAYVQKLAAYEAAPGAQWIDQAMFFADATGPDDGVTDYAGDSVAVAGALPPLYAAQQTALSSENIAAARATLFAGLANGTGLINYLGHAGLDRLSSLSLLTSSDATTLTNGPRLPLLAALTCNVNRFDVPGFTSLGEYLANQPGGGAIAIWSSSGLSYHPEGKELARLFYQDMGGLGSFRLGDLTLRALTQYANEPGLLDTVNLYTLLGDPAIQVKPLTSSGGTGTPSSVRE